MDFQISQFELIINRRVFSFESAIRQFIDYEHVLIIITDYYSSSIVNNVWAFNQFGEKIWQVNTQYDGSNSQKINMPFVGIKKIDENTVNLYNLDGTSYKVFVNSGKFIKKPSEFRKGTRPW